MSMNEYRESYVYSFDCAADCENFRRLPRETQSYLERFVVKVIIDSFVKPADEDYLTARFLAQKGMYRAFYWAASQAVEKYLKAFLLMRGVSLNKEKFKGHPIRALFEEASSVESNLSISTKPHSLIRIHENVTNLFKEISVSEFLKAVEEYGSPDNRYNSFGVIFNSAYLFALDTFVFTLRSEIGIPAIQKLFKHVDDSLLEAFYAYNPWFSESLIKLPEIPHKSFKLMTSCSTTTLDFLVSENSPHGAEYILKWLNDRMKLPSSIRKNLK